MRFGIPVVPRPKLQVPVYEEFYNSPAAETEIIRLFTVPDVEGRKLLMRWAAGSSASGIAEFCPEQPFNPANVIPLEIKEATPILETNLRLAAFTLDNIPPGPVSLRLRTSSARSCFLLQVYANARVGSPEAVTVDEEGTTALIFDVDETFLVAPYSDTLDITARSGSANGVLVPFAGQEKFAQEGDLNNQWSIAFGRRRHTNNVMPEHGWGTVEGTPAATMISLAINIPFGIGEEVEVGDAENLSIWNFNGGPDVFVDTLGRRNASLISGTYTDGVDPLLADGGKSIGVKNTVIAALNHPDYLSASWFSRGYDQIRSLPAVGTARTLTAKDTNLPPGGWAAEVYNDNGVGRLRAYIRNSVGGMGSAIFIGPQVGEGEIVIGTAFSWGIMFDDVTKTAYLLKNGSLISPPKTDPNFHGGQNNPSKLTFGGRDNTPASTTDGFMDKIVYGRGNHTLAEFAAFPAPVTIVDPGEPSPIQAVDDSFGQLSRGGTQDFDVLANDLNLTPASIKNLVITQQPSGGSIEVLNNNTTAPTIRITKTSPTNTTVYSARYRVSEAGGNFSNEANLSWSIPGVPVGDYTPYPFVTNRTPPKNHTGLHTRPPFNAMNPRSQSRICPMSTLEFFRVTGNHGTPVLRNGDQPTNLNWSKYITSENACQTDRGFNRTGTMLALLESKDTSGDPPNRIKAGIIACVASPFLGSTQPWQLVRASGTSGFGQVTVPGCGWDHCDEWSMYSFEPDGVYRYWPMGRPAGDPVPFPGFERGGQARAVGAKVKLFNYPVPQTGQWSPRGGRWNQSADGRYHFSAGPYAGSGPLNGKHGGYKLDLWTGQAAGPFMVNPKQDGNLELLAIGKTSQLAIFCSFGGQPLGPNGSTNTQHHRFFDVTNGNFLSEEADVGGGHVFWYDINGQDYFVGKNAPNSGLGAYDPLTDSVRRLGFAGNGIQHMVGMNYLDTVANYGVPTGSGLTSGRRYAILSTSTGSEVGIYAYRTGPNDGSPTGQGTGRYIMHPRGSRPDNRAEVHPQADPEMKYLSWNSNWCSDDLNNNEDPKFTSTFVALIPDAWRSPNNNGS